MDNCTKSGSENRSFIFTSGISRLSMALLIATMAVSFLSTPVHAQSANPTLLHPDDNAQVSEEILSRRWPNGVVPFELNVLESDLDGGTRFHLMNKWEDSTKGAVRFVESSTALPRIKINLTAVSGGNNSTFGLRGIKENDGTPIDLTQARNINIRPDQDQTLRVNHELGHVLGRWHQQRHPNSGRCLTLEKTAPSRLGNDHFIGSYSSDSVMHYPVPQADYETASTDVSIDCPAMTDGHSPSDFDVRYFQKMYGVNGDYFNNVDWCKGAETYIFAGDFNGDGLDDLLCHTKDGGQNPGSRSIDFAEDVTDNVFGTGDWQTTAHAFCRSSSRELKVGDLNADGQDDLLCFDRTNGRRFVDFAGPNGELDRSDVEFPRFCVFPDMQGFYAGEVYIADFDGDRRNDMLCHDGRTGQIEIDFAHNGFNRTDWSRDAGWCQDSERSVIVGNFSEDHLADLVCHDSELGTVKISYSSVAPFSFAEVWDRETDFKLGGARFCTGTNKKVYAGDTDGNGQDDLICHDRRLGSVAIDFALGETDRRVFNIPPLTTYDRGSDLWFANYYAELSFCNAQDAFLLVGQFPTPDGNSRTSLYCNNMETGHQVSRYTFGN